MAGVDDADGPPLRRQCGLIFVSVGTQLPFDRLIRAVDQWAAATGRTDVFAQIGPGKYRPDHVEWRQFVEPAEFQRRVQACDVLVAHAGMGSILTALAAGKPLLVLPRRAALGEHRNDHQLATAERFAARGLVHAARDEQDLREQLDRIDDLRPAGERISPFAEERLLERLRRFVAES